MKINFSVKGRELELVPYQSCHVEIYSDWLSDPYLQSIL